MNPFTEDESGRYFLDTLYGKVYPDNYLWNEVDEDFWEIITSPELQRLRYVRVLNTNSLFMPGAADVNRFEHALGTYHLAKECLKSWPKLGRLKISEQRNFLIASLLHDFATPPFGHAVEYLLKDYEFEHEEKFFEAIWGRPTQALLDDVKPTSEVFDLGYQRSRHERIFMDKGRQLVGMLKKEDQKEIGQFVRGEGRFGPLLNAQVDLDNIDYVFRLAYHAGLTDDPSAPIKLAKMMSVENGEQVLDSGAVPVLKEWHNVREKLYNQLIEDPGELAAECMLQDCIRYAEKHRMYDFNWFDVDFEFVQSLTDLSNYVTNELPRFVFKTSSRLNFEGEDIQPSDDLIDLFKSHGFDISGDRYIIDTNNDPGPLDDETIFINDKKMEEWRFRISQRQDSYYVFKRSKEVYQISNIISRFMSGKYYGCVCMAQVTAEKDGLGTVADVLENIDLKLEMDDELSQKIKRETSLKNAQVSIHLNVDIGKSRRKTPIRIDDGRTVPIGNNSHRLVFGVFLKNNNYDIFHVNNELKGEQGMVNKICIEFISDFVNGFVKNPTIKSIGPFSSFNDG